MDILTEVAQIQTKLFGIYTHEARIKEFMRLKYDRNYVLNNTLANLPYHNYSILLLIQNTFYGSARVLMRQFFEALIFAKYSEYDNKLIEKWEEIRNVEGPIFHVRKLTEGMMMMMMRMIQSERS